MTGINYSEFITQLGTYLESPVVDASSATPFESTDYNNALAEFINDGEQRIYREIDFLSTRIEATPTLATASSRTFTIPSQVIVMEGLSVITPVATTPAAGKRNRLNRVSVDYIDMTFPNESVTGTPLYYAMLSNTTALLAPSPSAAFQVEVTGRTRPAPLSSTNTTTYLATNFPDLFFAACMTQGLVFNRDFAQGDGQQNMLSWEAIYQERKASVIAEEARRKGLAPVAG